MGDLIRELLRPYRRSLLVILAAMIVQSLMSMAAPWPLKFILDNVILGRKLTPGSTSLSDRFCNMAIAFISHCWLHVPLS
jgi:ABC-type multidrug transport system fused ATPase/permease subunit